MLKISIDNRLATPKGASKKPIKRGYAGSRVK